MLLLVQLGRDASRRRVWTHRSEVRVLLLSGEAPKRVCDSKSPLAAALARMAGLGGPVMFLDGGGSNQSGDCWLRRVLGG